MKLAKMLQHLLPNNNHNKAAAGFCSKAGLAADAVYPDVAHDIDDSDDDGETESLSSTTIYLEGGDSSSTDLRSDDDDQDSSFDDNNSFTHKRVVSFAETATVYEYRQPVESSLEDDHHGKHDGGYGSWYSVREYQRFRRATYLRVKQLHLEGNYSNFSFTKLLHKTYKTLEQSSSSTLSSFQQDHVQGNQEQEQVASTCGQEIMALKQWYRGEDYAMLGLERKACVPISRAASNTTLQLLQVVALHRRQTQLGMGLNMRYHSANDGNDIVIHADDDETLRQQCEALTQPSKDLARLLAMAQWEATPLRERNMSNGNHNGNGSNSSNNSLTTTSSQPEFALFGDGAM